MSAINADAGQATDDAEQQDLTQELETFLWPEGTHAPSGRAWESLELATEDIKRFMQTQGCLGLKIKNQTYFDAARTRVKKRVFKCPRWGAYTPRAVESIAVGGRPRQTNAKKTDCSVYINVNVNACTGEARVTTSSHSHNHALSGPDTQATAVQQELSAALTESIQEWAQCGLATTAIRQLVQLELSVPFLTSNTKKKISNLVQKAADAKVDPLDAHKFIQTVAEQPGAFLEYRLDAQGCLEAVVWALPEQVEAMQLYGDVWIQDNTCKTLVANRPFFAVVGVDGNSRTRLLVQGVLKDESGEQFLWALAAVKRLCQDRLPESIFTDADLAAELALNTLFPSCGKYRCLWHLSQNIAKKLKKAMGSQALQELTRCFRAAVYATTESEMRAKWDAVMQCADISDGARGVRQGSSTAVSAVKYMEHILLDERRWACWYRTGRLTLGIASTQRCEGFFGKLKQQLGLISSLQHLGSTVHSLSACDEFESRLLTEGLALRTSTQLLPGFDRAWGAILDDLKSCGTHFLYQHVAAETAAAAQYVVHEQSNTGVDGTAVLQADAVCGGTALEAPDPEGPDRDLLRLGSCSTLQSPGDARVFRVHYHTAYAASQPAVHTVKVGRQRGVHMCSCLQLAHRGLPCRHYFAVLLHDQSLQFDVDVIHPRWFTRSTARSLASQTPAEICSPPVDAERLRAVQYMTMEAIKGKIEQLSGSVRGLKSKSEYVERLLKLEAAASSHTPTPVAEAIDVASRSAQLSAFEASMQLLGLHLPQNTAQSHERLVQVRRQFTRQRIYVDALASCKSLVSMLAEHGSEHHAQEALQMFEGFVKLRVTPPDIRVGNLPTSMVLRGRATGQRLRSAAETEQPSKRQRTVAPSAEE